MTRQGKRLDQVVPTKLSFLFWICGLFLHLGKKDHRHNCGHSLQDALFGADFRNPVVVVSSFDYFTLACCSEDVPSHFGLTFLDIKGIIVSLVNAA